MTTAYIERERTPEQERDQAVRFLSGAASHCDACYRDLWQPLRKAVDGSSEQVRLSRASADYSAARAVCMTLLLDVSGVRLRDVPPPITTEQWMAGGIIYHTPRPTSILE